MITFNEFQKIMAFNLEKSFCIEILFVLNGSKKFNHCWMGKTPDRSSGEDVYWFGLTKDGKNAYDYPTFEEMGSAKVFDGKSLSEVWNIVSILEVDGCDPKERFDYYLN